MKSNTSENIKVVLGVAFIILNTPLFLIYAYSEECKNDCGDAMGRIVTGFLNTSITAKTVVTLISLAVYASFILFVKTFITC